MDRRRASRNALAGVAQTLVSAGLMFVFYRLVYAGLGAGGLGVWSVVLASTGVARVAELGFTGSAVKYTAGRLAQGDREGAALVAETTVVTVAAALTVVAPLAYVGLRLALPAFVAPEGLADAQQLLPYACASLWLAGVAGAAQSGLDGCGRVDQRNLVALVAQVAYVVLGVGALGTHGLVGLAVAQIVQGVVLGLGSWAFLRRALPEARRVRLRWRRPLFREMLSYSLNYQGLGLLRMLYEPTTKALMSRYGGLAAAGVYEMASLAVTKLRALLIAAQQALTPEVAGLAATDPGRLPEVYRTSAGLNGYLSVPTFSLLIAAGPLASSLLVGGYNPTYVLFATLVAVGWFANTLSGPIFFVLLGTGEMRGLLAAHLTTGVVNAVLAVTLGMWLGGAGVALAWAVALGAGAVHLLRYARPYGGGVRLPAGLGGVLAGGVLGVAAAAGVVALAPGAVWTSLAAPVAAAAVVAVPLWRHPYRARLSAALRQRRAVG